MTQRSEKRSGLPSFFQDNPWLNILAQRGAEPLPNFIDSEASSVPAVSKSSPATPTAVSFLRELEVGLKVPSELIKAIRELKEAIIMALSMSQRQATIVPICIPTSVAQLTPQIIHASILTQGLEEDELICPKCGRPGRLIRSRKGKRTYILVLHGRQKCYLGPKEKVREKWPNLLEQGLVKTAQRLQAWDFSLSALRASNPVLTACQTQDNSSFLVRGVGFEPTQAYATGASGPPL